MGQSSFVSKHINHNAMDQNGYATFLWYSFWCLF